MKFLNGLLGFPEEIMEKKLFIVDLDGTVYIDNRLIYKAKEFLEFVEKNGAKVVFLTNNSSKSKAQYLQKLTSMGLKLSEDNIFSSNEATAFYLNSEFSGKKIMYMGTFEAAKEMKEWGINIVLPFDRNRDEAVDAAVLAYDTGMTYDKLSIFCLSLRRGIPYISTHPDYNCPSAHGPLPDNGSFIELIKASTGRVPDKVVGKPNGEMISSISKKYGVNEEEMMIIGDRLYTDIKMGIDNKVKTILVLSGETKECDLGAGDILPDYVVESIGKLYELMIDR